MDDVRANISAATSPDMSRPGATVADTDYSLTIEQVADIYANAGHPRTPRSIQRYAATGHLEAKKKETALGGEVYLVTPQSVARHIAQIEELIASDPLATRRDTSRPVVSVEKSTFSTDRLRQDNEDASVSSSPTAPNSEENPRPQADDKSRHVATDTSDVSPYVAGLEREVERAREDREFLREQIKTKDRQIEALLERDRETNILVRGLQQMLSPLLAPPRRDADHGSQSTF